MTGSPNGSRGRRSLTLQGLDETLPPAGASKKAVLLSRAASSNSNASLNSRSIRTKGALELENNGTQNRVAFAQAAPPSS